MIEYLSLWSLSVVLMALGCWLPALILAAVAGAIVFRSEWLV